MVTLEQLEWTLNIGLDKAKEMLRVATNCVICTEEHPFSRRYRTDHLGLRWNNISGRWYFDCITDAIKSIKQCKGVFVYYNGTLPKF